MSPRPTPTPDCAVVDCIRTAVVLEEHVIFSQGHLTIEVPLCGKHKGGSRS